MTALWLAGAIAILTWGVLLLTNPHGAGVRLVKGMARRQARWQQSRIARHTNGYRISFGVFGVVIGSLWILALLAR